ncbi:hypothetical protein CEXT_221921 [Caerostris extrusa]|uniref:Uncharacterized protein n=1 Tax=Caerostris extrusa TaxID=172846 RepID=A0AAV4PVY3_CAEEX|nr:hypothetical protein CEXT_221921 [Caerostris extrusa]
MIVMKERASVSLFKPISIPIPIPVAYVEKGSMKAEKHDVENDEDENENEDEDDEKDEENDERLQENVLPSTDANEGSMANDDASCMMNGGWPMKGGCPPEEPEEEEEEMQPEVEDWPDYYERRNDGGPICLGHKADTRLQSSEDKKKARRRFR